MYVLGKLSYRFSQYVDHVLTVEFGWMSYFEYAI